MRTDHTTSSSVHSVAEATLKSMPPALTCATGIRVDKMISLERERVVKI